METRKVKFQELPYQFYPEPDEELEEMMKEKEGLFHQWVTEEIQSPQSGEYVPVTKALIEKKDGTMVTVDYERVKFID